MLLQFTSKGILHVGFVLLHGCFSFSSTACNIYPVNINQALWTTEINFSGLKSPSFNNTNMLVDSCCATRNKVMHSLWMVTAQISEGCSKPDINSISQLWDELETTSCMTSSGRKSAQNFYFNWSINTTL